LLASAERFTKERNVGYVDAVETGYDSVRGRWIYAAWKHLRRYDATAVGLMSATAYAGRAGDLLGRVRMLKWYSLANLGTLALDAGIGPIELETLTIPRLKATGAIQVGRDQARKVTGVVPLVLGETDVLGQIAAVWDTLHAPAEEIGALEVLRACAEIPRTRDELLVHESMIRSRSDARLPATAIHRPP
jgi:hypothetical protein